MNSAKKAKTKAKAKAKKSAQSNKRGRPPSTDEKMPSVLKEIKNREFYAPEEINVRHFYDNYCKEPSSVYLTADLAVLLMALSKNERRTYSNTVGGVVVEGLKSLELLGENNEFTEEAIELIESLSS